MQPLYKKILILLLSISSLAIVKAGDPNIYAVSNIPPQLIENAGAVVREHIQEMEVFGPDKFVLKQKLVITILKESKLEASEFEKTYSKFSKISDISATVYDSKGEKVKKIKTDEILDLSAISEGTIYSDLRRKVIDPRYQNFPFTVEYSWTETVNTAFLMPMWSVFYGYNTSVEKSSIKLLYPDATPVRYLERNIQTPMVKTSKDGKTECIWTEQNFLARNVEYGSINPVDLYPSVWFAPTTFEMDGIKGDMTTWQNFGKFIGELIQDKDILPAETISKMQDLVKECKNEQEKVKKIYEYAQKKNRYISVQVGIGGWQPFDAQTVDRLSYGDCKALSNYTKSLLKAVGINAYYTVIESDDVPTDIRDDFPINHFNHIVLSVPMEKDTLWLECTNSHIPCGYFGSSTDNRRALMITEEGGKLVHTIRHNSKDNFVVNKGEVKLSETADASGSYRSTFHGSLYGPALSLKLMDETDRRKAIIEGMEIPNFQLVSYQIDENRSIKPDLTLNVNLAITNCATLMGNRMMLKPAQYNSIATIPSYARKRESPLLLANNYAEYDTISYVIPQGYTPEAIPPVVNLTTRFGNYQSTIAFKDQVLVYIRRFEIFAGKHEPAAYNEFREFLEKVSGADNAKCVFTRKD